MISNYLKRVELARSGREGALLRHAEVVVDAHVVVDAGFLFAGSAAEAGRGGLVFGRELVEDGLEEIGRVFLYERVGVGRIEGVVSDFVQTLHLLKVSAGDRNSLVLVCEQVDLLLQLWKGRLTEIIKIHPMHDCLWNVDIFLVLAAAEVTSLALVCKLKTRNLFSQSKRQGLAAFIILFLFFVHPALQTTLDDSLLCLHQGHHSVDDRVVCFEIELGLEGGRGDPYYHRYDGCRFPAVPEVMLPQQLVKSYPISLVQINAYSSLFGLRPVHRKVQSHLAGKHTAHHFRRITILMGHIALRVLLDHALAGELKEVVLSKRAEKGQTLQKLKFLLVGFTAQHFLHLHHSLLPLPLHNGQFLIDMEASGQPSLHSQHLAIGLSSISHSFLLIEVQDLTSSDLSTGLKLQLLLAQVALQQHVVIALADETKPFAEDERMQGLEKEGEVIRTEGGVQVVEVFQLSQQVQ